MMGVVPMSLVSPNCFERTCAREALAGDLAGDRARVMVRPTDDQPLEAATAIIAAAGG